MDDEGERFDWKAARARIAELGRALERDHDTAEVERVLAERAERYRQIEHQPSREGRLMIVFSRGDTTYAVPIEDVSEIRIADRITALPGISQVIKGVLNVRGRMTAIHDLASFGRPSREPPPIPWVLIGYGATRDTALLADDVDGIRRFLPAEIRPAPLSLTYKGPGFTGATADGVVILDPAGLVASPDFFFA